MYIFNNFFNDVYNKVKNMVVGIYHNIKNTERFKIFAWYMSLFLLWIIDKYTNIILSLEKNKQDVKLLYNTNKEIHKFRYKAVYHTVKNIIDLKKKELGIFITWKIYTTLNIIEKIDNIDDKNVYKIRLMINNNVYTFFVEEKISSSQAILDAYADDSRIEDDSIKNVHDILHSKNCIVTDITPRILGYKNMKLETIYEDKIFDEDDNIEL